MIFFERENNQGDSIDGSEDEVELDPRLLLTLERPKTDLRLRVFIL